MSTGARATFFEMLDEPGEAAPALVFGYADALLSC